MFYGSHREENEKGAELTLQQLKNSQTCVNRHLQGAQTTPNKMNIKRPTLQHIIKFSKLKENIESHKSNLLYSRETHKPISGFLQAGTLQPGRKLDDILKLLKAGVGTAIQEFFIQ